MGGRSTVNRLANVLTASVTTLLRGGIGMSVRSLGARPALPIELYEFEGCPFCRRVREALTLLDLEAFVRPCPKGGRRFRDELRRLGGKAQFPYMKDPNTGEAIYESGDIVDYLFARYGEGPPPALLRASVFSTLAVSVSGLGRGTAGSYVRASRPPEEPLELFSFEASPFCRLVRESLCELEIPYLLHNVARGSARREAFMARSGRMQVPYLVDPNRSVAMFESAEIIEYLQTTYAEA
jgi:glutathione S-transferase